MPQVVAPALVAAAGVAATGAAATAITVGTYAAFLIGGSVVARRQQRKALREANAQLQDRRFPVRGSAEPKQIVLGRVRVGGVQLAPGWTHGADNREWTVPIGFAGHEIDGFEALWFGEKDSLFSSTTPGAYRSVSAASDWSREYQHSATAALTGGSPSATATVPGGSSTIRVDSIAYAVAESTGADSLPTYRAVTLTLGVDYTVARVGANLVVTWLTDQSGRTPIATYTYETSESFAAARFFLGGSAGERDTDLESNSGGEWTSTDVGKGIARVHFRLTFDENIFPTGAPQVSAILRGAKLYDPRLDSTNGGSGSHRVASPSTWTWSCNPALAWAWYMMNEEVGFGVPASRINWPSVITAANVCDEDVSLSGGGTQNRYECHVELSTSRDIRSNVDAILSSMCGIRFYSGGQWYVRAGAYSEPVVDLTEDDFAGGEVRILPRTRRRELFNSIRGKFIDSRPAGTLSASDAGGLYAPTDFPAYSSPTYVSQDGGRELWSDIELPATTDWRMAQRIGLLTLNRHRQALTCSGSLKVGRTYKLQPGDTFRLTSPTNGWTTKVFRVIDRSYAPHGDVGLVFQEEASAVYGWSAGDESAPDPAPNTELPDPRIISPLRGFAVSTGAVYELPDGTRVPYAEASWDAVTDSAVLAGGRIEIWWKRSIDTLYRQIVVSPSATSARIEPVSGGDTLNVFGVAINGSQVRSMPAFATVGLSDDLPAGAYVPALSANLVRNALLDVSTASWSTLGVNIPATQVEFRRYTDVADSTIAGSPSNCMMIVSSTLSSGVGGDGLIAIAQSAEFSVDPNEAGARWCAYADLVAEASDAKTELWWLDSTGQRIGLDVGNVVAGTALTSFGRTNNPATYERSIVFATQPAGARRARLAIVATGNWTANKYKYISIFRPFAGMVPQGSTEVPPWDGGAANVVDTELLNPGAATTVYRLTSVIAGPIAIDTVGATISDIVRFDDLRGYELAATVTFDYTVRNRGALAALLNSYCYHVLIDGNGTSHAGPVRTIFASSSLPVGFEQTSAIEITHRWVIDSSMPPPYTFRVSAKDKFLIAGGAVDVQASSIDYGVEVIKR